MSNLHILHGDEEETEVYLYPLDSVLSGDEYSNIADRVLLGGDGFLYSEQLNGSYKKEDQIFKPIIGSENNLAPYQPEEIELYKISDVIKAYKNKTPELSEALKELTNSKTLSGDDILLGDDGVLYKIENNIPLPFAQLAIEDNTPGGTAIALDGDYLAGFKFPKLGGFKFPKIKFPKLPKLKLPKIKLPKLKLPKFKLPKIKMPKLPKLKMPKLPKIKLPDPGQLLNQLAEGAKDLMSNLGPGGGMSEDYPEEEENLEDEYSEDGYEDEYSEEGYEDEYSEEGYEDEYSEEGYEDEYFEEVEDFGTYNTDTEQAYLLRGDDPETLDGFFDWLFGRKKTTSEEIKDFNKTNIVGDVCEKDLLGFDFSSILNMGTNMMNASPQNRTDMANSAIGTGLNAFLPGAGSVFQQGMGIYNQAQRNKQAKKKAEAEKRKKTLLALLNKNKKPSPKPRKKIKRPTPRPIPKKNLQTVSNYPPPPTQYMASNQKNNTALIVGGVGVGAVALILLMNNKPRGRR